MIKKETIYQATNGGLDVFRILWSDAKRIIDNGEYHKSFKIRPDERTGSAHLKQVGQGTEQHWVATDFGDDGLPKNCFDWVIKERNLQGFRCQQKHRKEQCSTNSATTTPSPSENSKCSENSSRKR